MMAAFQPKDDEESLVVEVMNTPQDEPSPNKPSFEKLSSKPAISYRIKLTNKETKSTSVSTAVSGSFE